MEGQIQRLVVIADDLTGALDTAGPFCAAQVSVVVATRPESFADALARGADVTAVSTRSREVGPKTAHARVAEVLTQVPRGCRLLKKVDSRLKGEIAAELEALPDGELLVLPAIPEFGRVVRAGRVEGFGVASPIDIRGRLGRRGAAAVIPDTATPAEIVAALRAAPVDGLLIGARGLAQALAELSGVIPTRPGPLCGKIGIAVGSTDPITLDQVAALEGGAHIRAPSAMAAPPVTAGRVTLMQATAGTERDPHMIARALARSFAPLARHVPSLILTGGATAEAVLDALDVDILDVEGEILPGLPLSEAKGWRIVTKSGGFGTASTLVDLTRELECM
ncbi:uncharacterized protein YgbK (DUF1537 family) [Primorskyibacter sedentarius]|uniref:Uncharacterized protein YgbK (DUF1537 family) n=1 Tax=Primorskyibacter sedentarius TaxID=745311 RepID=A0A4R3JK25_9RHOB|nr:four-carbon acid sugar kinase family protein [Primorskyibacter sedentarius]TCS66487.1 uncharacterized protein YgbK (DUF1537 family) [Primorskyibacter sedentarius]